MILDWQRNGAWSLLTRGVLFAGGATPYVSTAVTTTTQGKYRPEWAGALADMKLITGGAFAADWSGAHTDITDAGVG